MNIKNIKFKSRFQLVISGCKSAVLLPLEPPPHNKQPKRRGKELAKSNSNFLAPVKGSFKIASVSTNAGAWQGVTGDYGPDTNIPCDSAARRIQLETVCSLLLISDMVKTLQLRQIPDSNEGSDLMSNSLLSINLIVQE